MTADYITTLGLIAGAVTTISFLPQVARIYIRKSAADLSWLWLGVFLIGGMLWGVYGLFAGSLPVLATNVAMTILVISMIILKMKYDKKKK